MRRMVEIPITALPSKNGWKYEKNNLINNECCFIINYAYRLLL